MHWLVLLTFRLKICMPALAHTGGLNVDSDPPHLLIPSCIGCSRHAFPVIKAFSLLNDAYQGIKVYGYPIKVCD